MNNTIKITVALAGMLITQAVLADAPSYDEKMLMDPPGTLLLAEARGRVMIYDGLDSRLVERAMSEQFDRIDSMMFVRTRHKLPTGEEIQDDDC